MKPRLLCTECGAEIKWGDPSCSNCGKAVDWPSGSESEETITTPGKAQVCSKCGTENAPDASFCSSCGAALKGARPDVVRGQGQAPRFGPKQEKRRDARKKEAASSPLFSWKVILGFLGILLILFVAMEVFPTHEQAPTQGAPASSQAPPANMQLGAQILDLEKQVASNPGDLKTMLKLANVCQDGRFFDKAITYYKRYLQKNPKDADARVDLGISYFETGALDEAQKQMLSALKSDPKHLQAHFNLGIVNLRARRLKEANEWFKKTIALAPPNSEIGRQAKQFLEQHSSSLIQNQ